ncbi:glycosyltransferase family 2 protein, partial [Pseudomonas kairouanensis]
TVLELRPDILQVWLRNFVYDLQVHSPYIRLGPRELIGAVPCYPLISDKPEWQAFSLNPGLRRLREYALCAPYAGFEGEKGLSRRYAELNLTAVTLEGDAVLHTGFGLHVSTSAERLNKARRKRRERIKLVVMLLVGIGIGWFID